MFKKQVTLTPPGSVVLSGCKQFSKNSVLSIRNVLRKLIFRRMCVCVGGGVHFNGKTDKTYPLYKLSVGVLWNVVIFSEVMTAVQSLLFRIQSLTNKVFSCTFILFHNTYISVITWNLRLTKKLLVQSQKRKFLNRIFELKQVVFQNRCNTL